MELRKVYDELYGMIEDLKKQIGSGGGGGGIEINPEGAATDDLEKIKKGSSIYGLNYNKNANRPQINGNLLTGNKSSRQLNIAEEMSEAAYAALVSKNENEIYFLTENAPIFTESDTVASSGITWIEGTDPDTYEATLSYSVSDFDTTGVVGVTCDNELITIGDPAYESGTVSVPMICEDPTAITGDIEFIYTLTQPAGSTRIIKNGLVFGKNSDGYNETVLFDSTTSQPGALSDDYDNYDQLLIYAKSTNPSGDYQTTRAVLTSGITANTIYSISTDSWYSSIAFDTLTSFTVPASNAANIIKIVGIKF